VVDAGGVDPMLVRDDLPELQQSQQIPSLHAFPLRQGEKYDNSLEYAFPKCVLSKFSYLIVVVVHLFRIEIDCCGLITPHTIKN
jgi:hypothetical protein